MSPSTSNEPGPADSQRRRGARVALVIFALCAMPFVAAWFGYFVGPHPSQANYGDLIEAHPLSDRPMLNLDGKPFHFSQLRGKWVLLQIDSGACGADCRKKLLYMQQLRLSQGKDADRIERLWLVDDGAAPGAELLREYDGTRIARIRAAEAAAEFPAIRRAADHIYVVDPLGNLMLRFPADPQPRGMVKDMGRLLRVSRIG